MKSNSRQTKKAAARTQPRSQQCVDSQTSLKYTHRIEKTSAGARHIWEGKDDRGNTAHISLITDNEALIEVVNRMTGLAINQAH